MQVAGNVSPQIECRTKNAPVSLQLDQGFHGVGFLFSLPITRPDLQIDTRATNETSRNFSLAFTRSTRCPNAQSQLLQGEEVEHVSSRPSGWARFSLDQDEAWEDRCWLAGLIELSNMMYIGD